MAYYAKLKTRLDDARRNHVISNLLLLRKQLQNTIPIKDLDDNLLLATWNIRDFAKDFHKQDKASMRRGHGPRLPETWYYIAEVISSFDLVAVQEVNELDELEHVMDILGPNWAYIATDIADTRSGGNGERMTFIYDTRKVKFNNIAGEIVLPTNGLISKAEYTVEGDKIVTGKQFRRTPFMVSFSSGWLKFSLCTVHIYYGASSGEKLQERIKEIQEIANYLGYKANKEKEFNNSMILLGDFNIVNPEHQTMEALENNGFKVPNELKKRTNVKNTMFYDQIAFYNQSRLIDYIDNIETLESGVFELFENIFTDDQFDTYINDLKQSSKGEGMNDNELKDYYEEWRTYQFSDHKPLWVKLKINNTDEYLEYLKNMK